MNSALKIFLTEQNFLSHNLWTLWFAWFTATVLHCSIFRGDGLAGNFRNNLSSRPPRRAKTCLKVSGQSAAKLEGAEDADE
jgi:hypothetical protein